MYKAHRDAFLAKMEPGSAAFFPGAPMRVRSNDVDYDYRSDSDVHYLTGFPEPGSGVLLLPGHEKHPFVLFVRPRKKEAEIWTGRRAGVEGAVKDWGADAAFPIEELESQLGKLLENRETLYYPLGRHPEADAVLIRVIQHLRARRRQGTTFPVRIQDPAEILHEMRLIKDAEELERLRRATKVSSEAHEAAMREVRPGMTEYQVQAIVEYHFKKGGLLYPGYPTIAGSGPNATILHYTENRRTLKAEDLLLVDAGGEYEGYTADITRTYPAGGRFSKEQAALYDLVLEAQLAGIAMVRPGTDFQSIHDRTVEILTDGLLRLGLLNGDAKGNVEKGFYKKYFMHRTSHWLGIDVHDVGKYKLKDRWRTLEPGMVLTIEPGLYVAEDEASAPEAYRGIGIRIEDDVLVTTAGPDVLTTPPKARADLERIVGRG